MHHNQLTLKHVSSNIPIHAASCITINASLLVSTDVGPSREEHMIV
jgi:hypothetical protein